MILCSLTAVLFHRARTQIELDLFHTRAETCETNDAELTSLLRPANELGVLSNDHGQVSFSIKQTGCTHDTLWICVLLLF